MKHATKNITLKHLLINQEKQIGILFYPDKVIQALIKELPMPKWSNTYGMVYIKNNQSNLNAIFKKFRGVAWVNCNYFFKDKPLRHNNEPLNIGWFRQRKLPNNYKACPAAYFQKLEIKKYSLNTAKTYITLFEVFLNYYKDKEPLSLNENDIRNYLESLVKNKRSNSYINQ